MLIDGKPLINCRFRVLSATPTRPQKISNHRDILETLLGRVL